MLKKLRQNIANYKPYYSLLLKQKKVYALALFFGGIYALTNGLGMPFLLEYILPKIFDKEAQSSTTEIILAAMWLPIMIGIRGAAGFLNTYFTSYCGLKVLEDLRIKVFRHLQHLPLAYFQKHRSGDLLSRLVSDCQAVQTVVVQISNDLIRQPLQFLTAIGTLIYFAFKNNEIAVILLGMSFAPLCFFPIRIIGKKLLQKASLLRAQTGLISAALTDSLQAPREIRSFNLEEKEVERFKDKSNELFTRNLKVVKYVNSLSPINEFIGACAIGMAIAYQGINGMGLDAIVPLLFALNAAYEPIKKISAAMGQFQKGKASLDRLEEILHTPDSMPSIEPTKPVPELENLSFENVTFAYEDEPVLQNLNLSFKAGEIVALVGASGAGKSTFIQLIPRFYDPTLGKIKWNDFSIKEFKKSDLRDHISSVSQESLLFNDSIQNNIEMGKLGSNLSDIIDAAKKAHAHDFIENQPEGYQTINGERGTKLSGGQKQRLAIARAFLKDAPILILDEATSALDSESEQAIQSSLNELIEGKTAFIVAHRFSTIKIATRILVFDKGEVIADGNHDQLYSSCYLYKSLYDHQLQ